MKEQKGITLIALIITIIVMLILVGVSVTVALNGGLFSTAKNAKERTAEELALENKLDNGMVQVNGVWYNSVEDYLNNNPASEEPGDNSEGGQQGGATITWTHTDTDSDEIFDVGEVVTASNGESFYVIATPGENDETVKLLAAKCVDTSTNLQSDNYNTVAFDPGEWDENWENLYKPGTTTPVTNVYANASIKELVETYVTETLGLDEDQGRLMLEAEANALKTGHTDILYGGTTKWNYWLGSPSEYGTVSAWDVYGENECVSNCGVFGDSDFGVRPVIEISSSDID